MVLIRHISIALSAAVTAIGTALFIALNYFYKRRVWSPESEYRMIKEEEEDHGKRQVLVLGLDGAGKSSMLRGLTPGGPPPQGEPCRPTRGFSFISLNTPACQLDFLEIGGGEDLRRYWSEYLRRTNVLVYVVDASDRRRLPLAKAELHRLLRAADARLPVVVVGNKKDKANALGVSALREALSLDTGGERRVVLLTAQLGCEGLQGGGGGGGGGGGDLQNLQELLLQLI